MADLANRADDKNSNLMRLGPNESGLGTLACLQDQQRKELLQALDQAHCTPDLPYDCISAIQRSTVIDWLFYCTRALGLRHSSGLLACQLFDRGMGRLRNHNLDLVERTGIVSLILAAKYEEIYPPSIIEVLELSNGKCSFREAIIYEEEMLSALNFKVRPRPYLMMVHLLAPALPRDKVEQVEQYLAQAHRDWVNSRYRPMQIAKAVVHLVCDRPGDGEQTLCAKELFVGRFAR